MSNRATFDNELLNLQQDILRMASLVEQNIFDALEALFNRDPQIAKKVITGDDAIDRLRYEIEDKCIKLVATQQPMARDLRVIFTGIKILTNLERMGDHAVDIARAAMCVCGGVPEKALKKIPRMARLTQDMVRDGLDAYVNGDVEKARTLCAKDDEVDEIFNLVFQALVEYMQENPTTIPCVVYLLFVARYLERIADRATNIGEDVIYLVTGEMQELN
ncbi:MAG: phosphate signaling complex protein PhoU [Peptococcaceae bacterium]|nr:phosphate signaling complex protein PhoU [Peptococcaceae bacterium]